MKKIFAIIVVSMFGFAIGCGGKAPAVQTPEPEVPTVEEPGTPDPMATPDTPPVEDPAGDPAEEPME